MVDEENKQTTIIISHHLSTIRHIDKITMIHNGIIVELETHDLMKWNELYIDLKGVEEDLWDEDNIEENEEQQSIK